MKETADLADLLKSAKTIAVVGVSDKPDRPSHGVAKYLLDTGSYEVFLVNPLLSELFGQKVYAALSDIPVPIDIVDVFRKTSDLPEVFREAETIGAKNIWLQLGLEDEALASHARALGIGVVMNRCLKVDHAALIG
jgi:predicted CoA-binding protein